MPKSRKRKKKPQSRGRSGARPTAAAMAISPRTAPRLDPQIRAAAAAAPAIASAHVPTAIGKLVATVPGLDAVIREDMGIPPNVCVEVCRWLHYAYAQLGIRSVLSAAGLVVSGPAGNALLKAPVSPSWAGAVLDGHAILCLPEVRRFVDPTVEQYPEVARYRIGPVSGLAMGQIGGAVRPAPFVPGDQLIVRRKDLTLAYTLGDPAGTREIMGHWAVQDRTEVHRRAGINLATVVLDFVRGQHDLREAQIPRLQALLAAAGDYPVRHDPGTGDWFFDLPGRQLRLDELPLPPGTPGPSPEDPGLSGEDPGPQSSPATSGPGRLIMPRRLKASGLTRGWAGPGDTILRLARPGESADVRRLAATAGGPLDDQIAAAIEDRTAGAALVRALQGGRDAVTRAAAEALCAGNPAPLSELAAILVAERGGRPVAALCAVPPVAFIGQLMERGLDPPHAIVTSMAMMKIEAVAVDPAYRGQGIASALLGGCVALFDQLEYHLLYGLFQPGSGLAGFYSARGFDVAPAGHGVDVEVIVGQPCLLSNESGEQLFTRWRAEPPSGRARRRWARSTG
jgi:GNAT superfamily N-acetyltransferase